MTLTLSVLDQSPIRSGGTAADALNETLRLAEMAEGWGYHRYWLAEHHGSAGLAGAAPELLIARVAAATKTMRVGSGGIMLTHYSPLKVAETFALLETMYPGRIDLGLGRAPGGDYMTQLAMQYGSDIGPEYYPTKVADLKAFLTGGKPVNRALDKVRMTPRPDVPPQMWLLGSSDESAKLAAMFGLPFSYAHFISPLDGQKILAAYRDNFQPSDLLSEPKINMCINVICADTKEQADRLGLSRGLWRISLENGALIPYPSPEEAEAYPYTEDEKRIAERGKRMGVIGEPSAARAEIEHLAREHGVDEVMIVTICHAFAARARSYELVAREFGLKGPA